MIKKTAGRWRLIISKNLIMMLVVLAVILMAVFAWYTNVTKVTAEMTSISAATAEGVELALPNEDGSFPTSNESWTPNLDFAKSGYLKDLVKDITSDGQQFVMPNFEAAKGLKEGRTVITDDVWVEGLSSKEALINDKANDDDQYNYISFDFYIRSKSPNINITGDSYLAAGSELGIDDDGVITKDTSTGQITSAEKLTGTSVYRKSTYGAAGGTESAFSADAVVGAMRVSLVGQPVASVSNGTETLNGQPALKFLWLPRPDILLNTDNVQKKWHLTTGIKTTDSEANETYVHRFYHGESFQDNTNSKTVLKGLTAGAYSDKSVKSVDGTTLPAYFAVSKVTDERKLGEVGYYPTLGQSKQIASGAPESSKSITFTNTQETANMATEGYYVYKMTLNIWIEGEDAEARRSMNEGLFKLFLTFGT